MTLRRSLDFGLLSAIGLLVAQGLFVQGLLAPAAVDGVSMRPTLEPGKRVWIDRRWAGLVPQRGEVIVFRSPSSASELRIKRVLGLPGETVELALDGPRIDGRPVPWPVALSPRPGDVIRTVLGDDELFVVGDNTAQSRDSRNEPNAGVPLRLVVGGAIGVR